MKAIAHAEPAAWRQRYEALRQHVLERRLVLGADPLGLVILFAQGVASWMQSWDGSPPSSSQLSATPEPLQCPSTPQWHQQLTRLLVHMTALHL